MPSPTRLPKTWMIANLGAHAARAKRPVRALVVGVLGGLLACGGCATSREKPLVSPAVVVAPYSTSQGEAVFAVVPLRNETGDTMAPVDEISEQLLAAVEEIRGVRAVPMSRTLMAMRALEFRGIKSASELKALADALGADGVVYGSVSGYDPYTPAITLSVGLFARGEKMGDLVEVPTMSTRDLQSLGAEPAPSPSAAALVAASSWSDHLDGKNNAVQMAVRAYAQGRQNGPSALGWRRYLASMTLFTEFATAEAIRGLMREEWVRMGSVDASSAVTANSTRLGSPGTEPAPRAQDTVTSAVDGE